MKKLFCLFISFGLMFSAYPGNQFRAGTTAQTIAGATSISDIDTVSYQNMTAPIGRLNANFQEGCKIVYASSSTITVEAGEIMLLNSAGTVFLMQQNAATITVDWTMIDTGSETKSTTYYLWAFQETVTDTDFEVIISTSSSAPSGKTYYARLGSFVNNASLDIDATSITNDNNDNFEEAISNYLYDSGWFAVAASNTYTKTHDLQTNKLLVIVYYSASSDGSNAVLPATCSHHAVGESGFEIHTITTTSLTVYTADFLYSTLWKSDGAITSGYARVLALALQ